MSLNFNKIENITFSLKYFNIIKNISDNYLNYIKSYHSTSKEYLSKLLNFQKDNNEKIKESISKLDKNENHNLSQIIKFIGIIPKIIDINLENLDYLIKNLEKEIKSYKIFLKEKETSVSDLKAQFEKTKNDFINKDNEINKLKNSFLNSMKNSEEIIYKFYSLQKEKEHKENNKKNKDKKNVINININPITEEQVNNSINNTKNIERKYKEILETGILIQDKYIQIENNSSENIKKLISDISLKLKQSIMNILISLKNNFKIPGNEIDNYLTDLISEKEKQKIEEVMDDYYENNPTEKIFYKPIKYKMQVLKTNNEKQIKKKKNHKNKLLKIKFLGNKSGTSLSKGENKVSIFEDGLEQISFINDEIALSTTKKMIESFDLINNCGYNFNIEDEKIETDHLSKKIIFNFKKPTFAKKKENAIKEEEKIINKNENNNNIEINNIIDNNISNEFILIDPNKEVMSITEQEIKKFEQLLDKHHNRIIFLQNLNGFRSSGNLVIPKKVYEIIGKLFNII